MDEITAEQIAAMSGSEVGRNYVRPRSRNDLEVMLIYISGYSPDAFAAALEVVRGAGEKISPEPVGV